MKHLYSFTLIAAIAFGFTSCEGYREAVGVAVDDETKSPLSGVTCTVTSSSLPPYITDSTEDSMSITE